MKKGFLLFLIASVLTASFTGCSEQKNESGNKNGVSTPAASAPAESEKDSGRDDNNKPSALKFDFEDGDCGFVPIFSDYPNSEDVEEFYEMKHEHGEIPISGAGKGLFISGNNHSDDLFMGYFKKIDGLVGGQKYEFSIKFKIATNVPGGMFGVGGSPGDSVYVKSGITNVKPENSVDDNGHFRLNIDGGHQGEGGKDMSVVGTIAKQDEMNPDGYDFNVYELTVSAAADENGEVYLIIGTDSGFESITSYYIDDVELSRK
ncbi:MAG: hypothetical protein HDT44_02695 [Ruminococcaceae bacterium]|nr:hypothetical protein [Oscillospiraceae bacterium]